MNSHPACRAFRPHNRFLHFEPLESRECPSVNALPAPVDVKNNAAVPCETRQHPDARDGQSAKGASASWPKAR